MSGEESGDLCPAERLQALVTVLTDSDGMAPVDQALEDFPADPRLHFLKGSLLAGGKRYPEARAAMGRAVELAPEYGVARFQLGFLEFTSGEADLADQTWGPLQALADEHPLRLFAEGLMRLPSDDIDGAIARLRRGMAANDDIPALNRDMQMLIDELLKAGGTSPQDEPTSETQMLLRQLGAGTKH